MRRFKQMMTEEDAVSPVIGVILMVAITVILAAVIATFVLGLGEQISATGPTASFDFEYDEDAGGGTGDLTVTHTSGNTIEAQNLYLRGDTDHGDWSGSYSKVSAGDSKTISVSSSETIRVVWESDGGSQTSTLEKWSGPDA